ncbi:MAG: ferrochelatase [Thermoguttaceae bacterium]
MTTKPAVLLVSYGAPETSDDIVPFLTELVGRARRDGGELSQELLERLAHPYRELAQCTGRPSPLLDACRYLLDGLRSLGSPLYWGNLIGTPRLEDAVQEMVNDGVESCVVVTTSPLASSVGCRRYWDRIAAARETITGTPQIEVVAPYATHPRYISGVAELLRAAILRCERNGREVEILFTAHSLPLSDPTAAAYRRHAEAAVCEVMRLVTTPTDRTVHGWLLCWQSRSRLRGGDWLTPDINDDLANPNNNATPNTTLIVVPIGFLCENKETVYDLDVEAASIWDERGWGEQGSDFVRVATLGTTPAAASLLAHLAQHGDRCDGVCERCPLFTAPRN